MTKQAGFFFSSEFFSFFQSIILDYCFDFENVGLFSVQMFEVPV